MSYGTTNYWSYRKSYVIDDCDILLLYLNVIIWLSKYNRYMAIFINTR
jgi:hypothetical protein